MRYLNKTIIGTDDKIKVIDESQKESDTDAKESDTERMSLEHLQ